MAFGLFSIPLIAPSLKTEVEDDNVLLFNMSRHRRISVEDKLRLLVDARAHCTMLDYQLLTDQLGINSSIARTIVSSRSISQCNDSQSVEPIR